nr:ABC transporter permease subunit [Lachnospiraceae bacterium]
MRYINPVYKKELKQTARMKKTLVLLLAYNLLLASFSLLVFYLTFDHEGRINSNVDYSGILTLYIVMTALEFVMVLLIVPASTAGAVVGEREKQTLDILLSTSVSPLQVIVGKLAASISMVILLAVSSMPVLAMLTRIGGLLIFDWVYFVRVWVCPR